MLKIDLNADVAEGFGAYPSFEAQALYKVITSANIACGFHAGDGVLMKRTIEICKNQGVSIGAHPGYRDLIGFGRRSFAMTDEELASDLLYQVGALQALAQVQDTGVNYVKLHGAWYNDAMKSEAQARVLIEALKKYKSHMGWLALAGSTFSRVCETMDVPVFQEAFADRGYLEDGSLAPRSMPGAVLHDPLAAIDHVKRMLFDRKVKTLSGKLIPIHVDSLCIHGDNPKALAFAEQLRAELEGDGVKFAAFSNKEA